MLQDPHLAMSPSRPVELWTATAIIPQRRQWLMFVGKVDSLIFFLATKAAEIPILYIHQLAGSNIGEYTYCSLCARDCDPYCTQHTTDHEISVYRSCSHFNRWNLFSSQKKLQTGGNEWLEGRKSRSSLLPLEHPGLGSKHEIPTSYVSVSGGHSLHIGGFGMYCSYYSFSIYACRCKEADLAHHAQPISET